MNTPICDFVRRYAEAEPIRFHMPGHKGKTGWSSESDIQKLDITEISGSDVLYDSEGIIRESEENAARLFGSARTVYSTEGSSLCIRAMLYLAEMHAKLQGKPVRVAAGRNAHRVFLETAALMDQKIGWLGTGKQILWAQIDPKELEALFCEEDSSPTAVYITSPDYLGHCADISALAEICRRHGAILLVDNAHGAYRKFLPGEKHPLECGADFCCDSAHKTLPVLTGGAYLHASLEAPLYLVSMMERAMALFSSTSPSWLTLQSLDRVNALLDGEYPIRIQKTAELLGEIKEKLNGEGWILTGDEALKLTICPKKRGWTGTDLERLLAGFGIFCEYADPDYLVLMMTPENTREEMERLSKAMHAIPAETPIFEEPPVPGTRESAMSLREAIFAPFERIPAERSLGRILASPSVSCPPAVPICICGERIDEKALSMFRYYGIDTCDVVLEG